LKVQGTLNFGDSKTKKVVTVKRRPIRKLLKVKPTTGDLFTRPLDYVDVSYGEA
jgi:hypothetical protein